MYALEVKSRFIDQSKADGYYKGYGDELAATIVGQSIQIGTGAFVVQGRMNEVTAAETVTPKMTNGYVGYVVARIETYHPSDEENCSFVAYVGTSLDAIPLTKDDIYAAEAETVNKVYELPIYSFAISGGAITNLQKIIGAVEDYAKINQIVTSALSTAQTALTTAQEAEKKSTIRGQYGGGSGRNRGGGGQQSRHGGINGEHRKKHGGGGGTDGTARTRRNDRGNQRTSGRYCRRAGDDC